MSDVTDLVKIINTTIEQLCKKHNYTAKSDYRAEIEAKIDDEIADALWGPL